MEKLFSRSQFFMKTGGYGIMGLHGPSTCSLLTSQHPHSSSTCPYPSPVLGMVTCWSLRVVGLDWTSAL